MKCCDARMDYTGGRHTLEKGSSYSRWKWYRRGPNELQHQSDTCKPTLPAIMRRIAPVNNVRVAKFCH